MKIIDHSTYVDEQGNISFSDRVRGTLKNGLSWYPEMQSQRTVIAHLARVLDNKFTLLRNIFLPEIGVQIPMVLVGPPGVRVLLSSPLRGIFRAKEETWLVHDSKGGFKQANPNLISRVLLLSRAVDTYLKQRGFGLPEIESVVVLSNPGIHVDTVRPAARVILLDAIERFAATLLQAPIVLNGEDIKNISFMMSHPGESIADPELAGTIEQEDLVDLYEFDEFLEKQTPSVIEPTRIVQTADRATDALTRLSRTVSFDRRQWLILGAMIVLNVIIIIAFILIVLTSA